MNHLCMTGFACALTLFLGAAVVPDKPAPASPAKQDVDPKVKRETAAKAAATEWFAAMAKADSKKVAALSGLPFAWDRKQIVETAPELDALLKTVFATKGARAVPPTTASLLNDTSAIEDHCFPKDRLIVQLKIDDEAVDVCVRPGSPYLVVGFSD